LDDFSLISGSFGEAVEHFWATFVICFTPNSLSSFIIFIKCHHIVLAMGVKIVHPNRMEVFVPVILRFDAKESSPRALKVIRKFCKENADYIVNEWEAYFDA